MEDRLRGDWTVWTAAHLRTIVDTTATSGQAVGGRTKRYGSHWADLAFAPAQAGPTQLAANRQRADQKSTKPSCLTSRPSVHRDILSNLDDKARRAQIGRASCRERV